MNKRSYGWGSASTKSSAKIDEDYKNEILSKSINFINSKIKPKVLDEKTITSAKKHGFNYTIDVYPRWYRNYLYFCTKCKSDSPNAIKEEYEDKFARLKYIEENKFDMSYMRHTGQWFELYSDITFEQALVIIEKDPNFLII